MHVLDRRLVLKVQPLVEEVCLEALVKFMVRGIGDNLLFFD